MFIHLKLSRSLSQDEIKITVNGLSVPCDFGDACINIDAPINFGLHHLRIESVTSERFAIDQVDIDGCNLRKLFYLHWSITAQGQRLQPCSELWEPGQIWHLPFGYPLSHWIDVVEQKFPNNTLGGDLSDRYWIWYPESLRIESSVPKVIKDFFEHNFDFTVVDKKRYQIDDLPYINYKPIDQSLISEAYAELSANLDCIFTELNEPYGQQKDNEKEFGIGDDQSWKRFYLHLPKNPETHRDRFPACWRLIDSLNLKYWMIFVGVLPPKSILYPHKDDTQRGLENFEKYQGCTQLYIPLHWPEGNYIKLATAGIPDVAAGPVIINNINFTHSVINLSDQYRYVLGIRISHSDMENLPIDF